MSGHAILLNKKWLFMESILVNLVSIQLHRSINVLEYNLMINLHSLITVYKVDFEPGFFSPFYACKQFRPLLNSQRHS